MILLPQLWMLVANDLRLAAREFPNGRLLRTVMTVFWLSILIAFAGRVGLATAGFDEVTLSQPLYLLTAVVLLIVFQLLFALLIRSVLTVLFDRKDLDVMLSSPLEPRVVLGARMISIALTGFFSLSVLTFPLLILGVTTFGWRSVALIPVVFSLSILAASLCTVMVLLLVRALGVTRTRVLMQLSGLLSMLLGLVIAHLLAFTPQANWRELLRDPALIGRLEAAANVLTGVSTI